MAAAPNGSVQVNTALFIDFDNIYLNLAEQDKQAAEKFATAPDLWLEWLEKQLPLTHLSSGYGSRRILIRRCYLNPNSFAKYRPHFIRSACEVIDCPPLTARGKTSTDIHLVMDALEALTHHTYFHEFIIFSGDADFTPLLLNLRKHARFSVVLPVGLASPAYKASCDYLINTSTFVETVLGIGAQDEEDEQKTAGAREVAKAPDVLLRRIADHIHKAASELPSGIPGNDLPEIYKEFPEFKQGMHWLGFFSLKRLTDAVVQLHDDLAIVEDEDSWFVTRKIYANWIYSTGNTVKSESMNARPQDRKAQVEQWIKSLVDASPTPIVLSTLAQGAKHRFTEQGIGPNWLGAGSFKNLLQQLDLGNLLVSSDAPGYIYDPNRHILPTNGHVEAIAAPPPPQDLFREQFPAIASLAKKINQLTDMPYLAPQHYALLFREIAREINERGYQMTQTSRTVRDRCIERGAPIARSHVNFVLTGLSYVGHRLGNESPETPLELGKLMVKNTFNMCRAAQFELSQEERELIHHWLLGELESDSPV